MRWFNLVACVAPLMGLLSLNGVDRAFADDVALPVNFSNQTVLGGWDQATNMVFAPTGQLYVAEKAGRVWVVENGVKSATPVLDIHDEVGNWGDHGLLGLALDPNFLTNGFIYLSYVVDYHHLKYFGTPGYDPEKDEYYHDTIGRITRYTCRASDGFRTADPASRFVLLGETMSTGFPICNLSHGVGTLAFGDDGMLLAGCGDGASIDSADNGGPQVNSSNTALTDGIIDAAQDVGAFRCQMIDSLSGKILRINPATGDGVPSNPFYDASNPRAARSRVWALGFRNPFRFHVVRGTGSANPADARPGMLLVPDVGWYTHEEFDVLTAPGANCGWPLFEGLDASPEYPALITQDKRVPNPLFGTLGCGLPYLRFNDLIIQDTLGPALWPNPCNPQTSIDPSTPAFVHHRPAFEFGHWWPVRAATFQGNDAAGVLVQDSHSPIQSGQFDGHAACGGFWYTGTQFPPEYRNTFYFADFVSGWIKMVDILPDGTVTRIRPFADNLGAVVNLSMNPADGTLWYIDYDDTGASRVNRIFWTNNAAPVLSASASPDSGITPLQVQFSTEGTYDPEGQPVRYRWDFGDGTSSTLANPTHTFYDGGDISNEGTIVARVFELDPPRPEGGGNFDPEIIRDRDMPPVNWWDDARQFDTYHHGDQGSFDYIGYTFPQTRTFWRLLFQEGKHFNDGGWFSTFQVEVRRQGVWAVVPGAIVTPAYPGNNGVNFESFAIELPAPTTGDGIRISGVPGGSSKFISVAELRVFGSWGTPGRPFRRTVTVTASDPLGQATTATIPLWLNDLPAQASIVSLRDGQNICLNEPTLVELQSQVTDSAGNGGLTCSWQTILHHEEHTHPGQSVAGCSATTTLSPHGSPNETFYYEIRLTVTDAIGLSTLATINVYSDCCIPDVNHDLFLDIFDFSDFVTSFEDGDPTADYNNDGFIDIYDLTAFVSDFEAGC